MSLSGLRHSHCSGRSVMDGFPDMSAAKSAAARDAMQGNDPNVEGIGPERGNAGGSRPVIHYSVGRPHEFADRAEQILLGAGADIFQRAGQLVRPGYVEVPAADNRTTIVGGLYEVDEAALTEELARAAVWMRFDRRSNCWIACDPPSAMVRILAARRGQWKLR